jgi:hypothetical protein
MFTINTSSNFINLTDPNKGYENFTITLKQLKFNWKKVSEYGYELVALAAVSEDDFQVCARDSFKPDKLMINGEEPIAFGVYARIYEALGQVRQLLYDQLGTYMEVIGISVTGSNKQELIVIFSSTQSSLI